jgi:hypothetical protein
MKTLSRPERLRRDCRQRSNDAPDGLVADHDEASESITSTQQAARQADRSHIQRHQAAQMLIGPKSVYLPPSAHSHPLGRTIDIALARPDLPSPWGLRVVPRGVNAIQTCAMALDQLS